MPEKNRFFFITTNYCWGASEYLWFETVKHLKKEAEVFAYIYKYQHAAIEELKAVLGSFNVFNNKRIRPLRFYKRLINKIWPFFTEKDTLKETLLQFNPDLVVISKGNAFGDEEIILLVKELGYKYIIINHLVSETSWPVIDNTIRLKLLEGINSAHRNYFVSNANKELLGKMTGTNIPNSGVIYNPVETYINPPIPYPNLNNSYNMALVGRLECLHKGLDVLFDVLKQTKWKERPIFLNIYGEGPHKEIINSWIHKYELKNVVLHGFIVDKKQIWANNYILILPSRMEGQSISLSEALYHKRTVIGTNVGGITEYIDDGKTGFIAKFANPKELDETMERAWQQRDKWKEFGESANAHWLEKVPQDPIAFFIEQLFKIA